MSTITYTVPAQTIDYLIPIVPVNEVRGVEQTEVSFTFEGDVSAIRYNVLREPLLFAEVGFDPEPVSILLDGVNVETLEAQGSEIEVYVGQISSPEGVSYVMNIFRADGDRNIGDPALNSFIQLGGAALPVLSSAEEVEAFLSANQDRFGPIAAGNAFGPGRDISLATLPDVVISRSDDPTEGPDRIAGGPDPDAIDGLGGNDTLEGRAGDDTLGGGEGNDVLRGEAGNDSLSGDGGDDDLRGGADSDTIEGDAGNDTVFGEAGNDLLRDGPGDDIVRGGLGNDTIENQGGSDRFLGDGGRDLLITDVTGLGAGDEILLVDLAIGRHGIKNGTTGQDTLGGIEDFTGIGPWDMEVIGNADANRLETGSGDDTLDGGNGADTLVGGEGSDIYVFDAADTILEAAGATGIDELRVSEDATLDIEGIEQLTAMGRSNIRLDGTAGDEILVGNAGSNILVGFGGEDTMNGGGGADSFVLTALRGTDPNVLITDWGRGGDRLAIDDQLLGLGARGIDIRELTGDVFRDVRDSGVVGYNSRTGELRLDIDGDGNRELVATLEGGAVLGLDDVLLF